MSGGCDASASFLKDRVSVISIVFLLSGFSWKRLSAFFAAVRTVVQELEGIHGTSYNENHQKCDLQDPRNHSIQDSDGSGRGFENRLAEVLDGQFSFLPNFAPPG